MNVRALALLLTVVGCATTPRPRALSDVQRAREGAAVERAEGLAPQAYLHAEKVYKSALRAHDEGDAPGAQLLSEQALAAYSHAVVLARVAEAERRLLTSRSALGKSEKALASIDEQQRQVAAEADDLEMRIKVARDALPLMPNEPASAERERARREAAHSLALQARLLCVSTKLLAPQLEGVDAELKAIDALDAQLAGAPRATPIDAAVRLRSSCLSKLTAARRAASRKAPEAGKVDALLEALSRADMQPARDDRGVVVVLRDAFRGAQLRPDVKKRIDSLGQTARENPDFPVLVVVHSARGGASAADRQRAASLADALRAAGATKVEPQAAGDAHPVVPKDRPGATQRNERVEVVFVAPTY